MRYHNERGAAVIHRAGKTRELPITTLYYLAVFLPSLAVAVRRLHDTNRSGWWILLGLVPLVGVIVLIVFYAQAGNIGSNTYGPDPKGAESHTGAGAPATA